MRKVRILVVSPPALSRVIKHLVSGRPEFEIVGSIGGLKTLAQEAGRLLPELIVANVKPVGTGICTTVVAIRNSNPSAKLIVICPIADLIKSALRCGADACVEQEKLVLRLLPAASALSASSAVPRIKTRHRSSARFRFKKPRRKNL
jgi:DNA-binding NarL/FixJ family response regulator